jgi:hypothetical protein
VGAVVILTWIHRGEAAVREPRQPAME